MNEQFEEEQWDVVYAPPEMQSFEKMKDYLITCENRQELVLEPEDLVDSKFEGGWLNATVGAQAIAKELGISLEELAKRHLHGDYGDMPVEDWLANDMDIEHGGHIISRYNVEGYSLYVETDGSRVYTTVMEVSER